MALEKDWNPSDAMMFDEDVADQGLKNATDLSWTPKTIQGL